MPEVYNKISVNELVKQTKLKKLNIHGDSSRVIKNAEPFNKASKDTLTFSVNGNIEDIEQSKADIIICNIKNINSQFEGKTLICVEDPRFVFIKFLERLMSKDGETGIHSTAIIDSGAVIGQNVYIGPYCVIGKAHIQEGTKILANTYVFDDVEIGKNVLIKPGAVLGGEGFGFQKDSDGKYHKFPHIGKLVIEDDVYIGSQTCIDRGTLGETRIKRGTKIDNFCHISHNVQIGENCILTAGTELSGSVCVEDNVWFSPTSNVVEGIKIGTNSFVGIGCSVSKNIEPNTRVIPQHRVFYLDNEEA